MSATIPSGPLPGPAVPEPVHPLLAAPPEPAALLPAPAERGGWPEDVHLPEPDEDVEC